MCIELLTHSTDIMRADVNSQKVNFTILDPEFLAEFQAVARLYDDGQSQSDDSKWNIARLVNEMWDEHKPQFPTKDDYYVECSKQANAAIRRKRFSDSGETLRRWCEVQATYANFKEADLFLSELSFDHLYRAKRLSNKGKVSVPVLALAEAVKRKWNAEEMQFHYDPPVTPNSYDAMKGRLDAIANIKSYEFLKSAENKEACVNHAKEIQRIINAEISAEGKAL